MRDESAGASQTTARHLTSGSKDRSQSAHFLIERVALLLPARPNSPRRRRRRASSLRRSIDLPPPDLAPPPRLDRLARVANLGPGARRAAFSTGMRGRPLTETAVKAAPRNDLKRILISSPALHFEGKPRLTLTSDADPTCDAVPPPPSRLPCDCSGGGRSEEAEFESREGRVDGGVGDWLGSYERSRRTEKRVCTKFE